MGDIPETYAGAWMRWSLYLYDHPAAEEPTFDVCTGDDPRVMIPPAFSPTGDKGEPTMYVVCTLDPKDGTRVETAWKDIPFKVKSYGKMVPVERTPDNWRKMCAGALGRALKEAGYPDDTRELHAVISWRRRDIELRALAAGVPVEAVTPAPDVTAAGRTEGDEHADDQHAEPQDAEVVGEEVQWNPETEVVLRPIMDGLPPEAQDEVRGFCEQRNLGPYWLVTNGKLRQVAAFARSKKPKITEGKDAAQFAKDHADDKPETIGDRIKAQTQASEAPESPASAESAQSDEELCRGCGNPIPLGVAETDTNRYVLDDKGVPWHARCVPFPEPDKPMEPNPDHPFLGGEKQPTLT